MLRRLLQAVPTLRGGAVLTLVLFHAVAPAPAVMALGQHATPQALANLRRVSGLDQPLAWQFVGVLRETLTGDYGRSFITGEDIAGQQVLGACKLLPDPDAVVSGSLQPPACGYATCLGTDVLGRSVLFRLLAGA